MAPAFAAPAALPATGGARAVAPGLTARRGAALAVPRRVAPAARVVMSAETPGAPKSAMEKFKESLPTPSERKKLVPLGIMFFTILFNYTILRDTKDVLVVTAAGAEIIPFLKTYCNLPGAILFTVVYAKLSNVLSKEKLFYACLLPFVFFFLAFGFGMYPNLATLHPSAESMAWLTNNLPAGFVAPLAIIKNWTFALFYTLAELWGSCVVVCF